MKYKKYTKDYNTIHEVEIDNFEEIKSIVKNKNIDVQLLSQLSFMNKYTEVYPELQYLVKNVSTNYQKEYINHGNRPINRRLITQNINCYSRDKIKKELNIYYDLTVKYNDNTDITFNRFILTAKLIEMYQKLGYQVKIFPTLFLKAFDNVLTYNEYVYIKFNNLNIDIMRYKNMVNNSNISRVLLPEIIKLLNIDNKEALDYNGYLLDREEKEKLLNPSKKDLIIDIFTTSESFTGKIEEDSKIFYKAIKGF